MNPSPDLLPSEDGPPTANIPEDLSPSNSAHQEKPSDSSRLKQEDVVLSSQTGVESKELDTLPTTNALPSASKNCVSGDGYDNDTEGLYCHPTNPPMDTDPNDVDKNSGCESASLEIPHVPTIQLTELPDLVVEEILRRLDTSTKLVLRLTCRITKEWVETPKFLSQFHVQIPTEAIMVQILNSTKAFPTAKWKNVYFSEKTFTSYALFPYFVSIFGDHITHLRISYFNGGLAQILFLSSSENLLYLEMDEIDLRENPELMVASDKTLKRKCPKLLDVFTGLKGLTIGVIYFNDVRQLAFYQTFLQRCRKLESLNVPRTLGPPKISWEGMKTIQLKSILGPINEYLLKKPVTSPIKSDIRVLNVEGLFSRHFPAVAEACVKTMSATVFENVNEKHVKYLFTHEGDILQRIVSLKEKIDDRRCIFKWIRLQKLSVRSSRCDIREEYPGYTAYPKLTHLTLVMDSRSREDPGFSMVERLVKLLVKAERPSLDEFILQWPLFGHDIPQDYIRAKDFCGNFQNLTKLHVVGWTAPDDDIILVCSTLVRLKVLILEECINLTDFGLIGPSSLLEHPVVMNLRDLRRLEVRNRNNPGFLTDHCFDCALKHLRLKLLLVESFHVTMKGYEYLLDGELRSTIEKFPTPYVLPNGVSQEEFLTFVNSHFPRISYCGSKPV